MSDKKIFLLGLPGSGKSTLGKELSNVLQLPFVDLDAEIEQRAGKKIPEIFSQDGEARFREIESAQLKKWCADPGSYVMATGGGTPCFFDNIEWINRSGTSIYLDVPVPEIIKRVEQSVIEDRPLLGGVKSGGVADRISRMYNKRLPFYGQAKITVSGSSLNATDILVKLGY